MECLWYLLELNKSTNKSTNELSKKLESCRIDIVEIIPPLEIAWEIRDDDSEEFNILGTLGNFSMVKGKAKSKKSFFINRAIAAAVVKGQPHHNIFTNTIRPLNEDYFKTLWSRFKRASKRIEQANTLLI